jgi:hypothetical protein
MYVLGRGLGASILLELNRMAARGFGKGIKLVAGVAGKAVKAVGEGAREGVKDVAKNITAAHLRSFLKGSVGGPRPMASALGLYPGMGMGMGMGLGGLSAQRMLWAPAQAYPNIAIVKKIRVDLELPREINYLYVILARRKARGLRIIAPNLKLLLFLQRRALAREL